MGILARAVIYGFGFSLGAALYKRVSDKLDLEGRGKESDQTGREEKASDSGHPPEPAAD